MKKILMLGAAFTLVAGVAFAESPAATPADPATPGATSNEGTVNQVDFDHDGPDGKWRHGWRHGDRGPGGDFRGPRGFGPPTKGAHVVLTHRGGRIDVKCADDDSTQQCVDAVKNLMDQVASTMRHHGPDGAPPPRDRDDRNDDSDQ